MDKRCDSMKIESPRDIWNLVCDEIKKTVSEIAFDVWLKDLHPIDLKNGEFILGINSDYKKQKCCQKTK